MSSVQEALKAREKRKKKEQENIKTTQNKVDSALEAYKSRKQSSVQSSLPDLIKRINTEIETGKTVSTPSWGKDSLKNSLDSTRQNRVNISNLTREVESYKNYLDEDTYNALISNLSQLNEGYTSHIQNAEARSQFENEDAYKKWKEENDASLKLNEEMMNFDLGSGQTEIARLQEIVDEYAKNPKPSASYYGRKGTNKPKIDEYNSAIASIEEKYGISYDEAKKQLSEKSAYYNRARKLQESEKLRTDALNAEDFQEYVQEGIALADKWELDFGKYASGYKNDIVALRRESGIDSSTLNGTIQDNIDMLFAKKMTEEQVNIYSYYLAKYGKKKANEYLDSIAERVNSGVGDDLYKNVEGKVLSEIMFATVAGLDQFASGVKNLDNLWSGKDAEATSAIQYASSQVREDLADNGFKLPEWMGGASVGQVGYDLINTTTNMLPSILVSTIPVVGQYASVGLLGASAAGNGYAEMRRLGYDEDQARGYGFFVGASEATLQYFLGGISKLGGGEKGIFQTIANKIVPNLDKAGARIAIQYGASVLDEGLEEALQEVLDPIFKALVTGEEFEGVNLEEVIYSGLLGMLSAGTLEGVPGAVGAVANKFEYNQQRNAHGQSIIDNGGTDALKQLALDMAGVNQNSEGQKLAKLAGKVEGKASAKNVGKLSAQLESTISEQNRTDIQKALVEKGLSEKDAKRVAEYLGSTKALTAEQKAEVEGNESIKAVVDELLGSSESAIKERERNLIRARLGTKVNASKSGELSLRNDVDVKEKVSETGETTATIIKDGKEVTEAVTIDKKDPIAKVKSVNEERVVYLNTDHGVVEASNIKYASKEEALLYESFVDMNPAFANAVIKNYDGSVPIQTYINGMREGMILYGMHNFQAVGKDISKNSFLADLSETDQAFALKLGRAYAKADAKKANTDLHKAIKNAAEKAKASEGASTSEATQNKPKKGKVSFENGVKAEKHHKKVVTLAKHLASAIGIDIVFYDARTTTNKPGEGANGYYDADTDTIYLDLQNAKDDAKTIAFTLSHELVHFIKKWSPQKYNAFAEFLMEQYASHGVSAATLLKQKMVELNTEDADYAYEEMIADACETMLLDSNAVVKLMELRKSDLELFEKIKLHVLKILNDIREAYKNLGYEPSSDEAKALLGMKDVVEKFYSMFEEAAVDATQTYQALGTEGYNEFVAKSTKNANETVFGEASVDMGKTESGVKHQLKAHKAIGEASIAYNDRHKAVSKAILKVGVESMYEMAEAMLPYLEEDGILPPDIPGKTIFKNGSYGKTGENTTLCVRTLTYEDFKDRVSEELGRPLTVSESLLVSQKIYDIATEPQCIYCYVAADRKAYDEYLGEYWKAMDKYIKAMRKGGDPKALYTEYLAGRKDTDAQKKRWSQWESIAKSGKEYISAKDLTTKRKRDGIIARKNAFSDQIKDAQRYAQSASWAKTVCDYRAYKGDILKMTSKFVDMLNSEYGLRMYSFSDYTPAFIVENMQMLIDASVKGLKSLAYTKDTDYVEIFASTGQAINVSCFARWDGEKGTFVEDNRQGANWEKTKNLRKQYRNVGAVMVATNDAMVEWALKQDWVDVVIPYHIVKTGTTIANEYQWNNYTSESADKVGNRAANIYPTEHNNDFATYSNLLTERGITPRFSRWYDKVASGELTEDQYMKLVNEVRLPASELSPVVPSFNIDAAKRSFGIDNEGNVIKGGFVDKGGYMGGWYRQGVDVNQEVMAVSEDIKAGKSSLDVDYGMSKAAKEKVEARYKKQAKKTQGNIYDYSKSFAEQIDDYKKGLIPQNDTLLVSGTPDVWKKVGFNALPVTINQAHVDYALNGTKDADHHIGETLLKDLPNAIETPIAIIQSQSPTRPDRAVVILKMTHNGTNVIGAIEVDGQGITNSINIDSNAMTSLFAKSNALTQLNKAINNTVNGGVELFYWNKKEAITLLQNNGLQLSKTLPQDGYVHSIHDNGSNVKTKFKNITETQQFKRWFGDWQKNPKKASKIVNVDGTPMVVYHGTNEDFSVFDANRTSRTTKRYAEGFYFTAEKKVAEKWGKFRAKEKGGDPIVMECFLDVKNPLIMTAKEYQRLGFDDKYRDSVLQKLIADKNDGIIIYPEEERIPGVFADSYNYEAGDSVYHNADKYGITDKDYAWWLNRAVENPDFTAMQVAVFKPEQIKSATDNIGTYDSNNPNIHYQKKKLSNREILASALVDAIDTSTQVGKNELEYLKRYQEKISLIEKEEEKLTELRAKIKELSFSEGKRTLMDKEQIRELQSEATITSNRIHTYDKQLTRLEAMKPIRDILEREKELVRKRTEQKGQEKLDAYREKMTKTQRELLTRYQDSRKKGIESRNKTEMRRKIHKVVRDLKALLLDPSKDKHVPIGLQKPVAEALDIINMDTVGADERVAKYNALIAKAKDPDVISELKKSRDRIESQGENLSDKLTALKLAYAEIKNSDDPLVSNSHNEAIEDLIANTAEKVGSTAIRDMSYEQLEAVYDMYKAVLATVRNANKMFKADRQESITDNSELVKREVRSAGGHRDRVLKATKWLKKFGWNMLKPIYAMKMIGSDTLTRLYENVRKGEDTWAVDVNEARGFFRETARRYNYNSWDFEKQYSFEDSAGHSFSLSLEQIMSLYAYSKREQADKHLEFGGFIFDDSIEITEKNKLGIPMKYEVNDANPYRLKKDALAEVISVLDTDLKEVKGFVDEMQAYLSDVMGAKGNEVSLAMYDIKLYKEKNYFPLKSAKYFREFDPEKNGTPKIKNSGFSKKTVPQAGNPIILSNFMDVWANHVNDMSMYHAFVLPLEDFMRVYNYSSTAGGYDSVQQYIKNAYGSQANSYIETLMNDLNGGARTDPSADIVSKGLSLFKKAKVFASASVVIQQPSAIARAMAYIDAKYFVDKPSANKHNETWAEVKKYAPVAIIKEMGYFDTNMGRSTVDFITSREYNGIKEKMGAVFTDSNYRDEVLSKAPALADELAWCAIWKAVKRETLHNHPNLNPNSEVFLKAVGERFTEVITKTQVYDSVLSRSAMMRSKDTGMKMATAFMAEPTTSLNMAVDAIIEGKKGNKKFTGKALGSVATSIILNSILVSIVYAWRDDDEDETYVEKYLESLTTELIDGFNPLTYIPFVKDIWSIMQGFDIERSDMSLFADFWASVENLFSENKSGFEKVEGVVETISSFFGLPLANIMRDARGMYNLATTLLSDTPTTKLGVKDAVGGAVKNSLPLYSRIEKMVGADDSKSDKLYEAIMSGDEKHIDRVKSQYKDQDAITSAIRKALRENDPRIKEAAEASFEGDTAEYSRIFEEILDEGNFELADIKAAIKSEVRELEPEDDSTGDDSDKVESRFEVEHFYSAILDGDNKTANNVKEDIINADVANGEDREEAEKSFETSFRGYVGKRYKSGEINRSKASSMLTEHGGYDSNETYWKLKEWDYKIANGEDAEYSKYNSFYEAVRTGRNIKAVISEYTSHGVKTSTLASQITSYYKPLYINMTNRERASLKGYLLNAYVLLGYNRYEKSKDIDKWLEK